GNVESVLSDSVVVIISGVSVTDDLVPAAITLKAAPNPFADIAVIRYSLPRSADVQLRIYNLRGQLVRTLDSGQKSAGEQILAWEGCDDRARSLGSGVYFLRLHVDGTLQSQSKLILMK
ncbi:MAG: FlgD immunoglobulin-like domain containing protein, partial [Candidatus Cloacimonadaceae bacterium]|nr:FlgD immunoglobulin-like domain containing protein [Candidatus Cloacimonadaceae bacterium]